AAPVMPVDDPDQRVTFRTRWPPDQVKVAPEPMVIDLGPWRVPLAMVALPVTVRSWFRVIVPVYALSISRPASGTIGRSSVPFRLEPPFPPATAFGSKTSVSVESTLAGAFPVAKLSHSLGLLQFTGSAICRTQSRRALL